MLFSSAMRPPPPLPITMNMEKLQGHSCCWDDLDLSAHISEADLERVSFGEVLRRSHRGLPDWDLARKMSVEPGYMEYTTVED
jgi:hypothetical protein